MEEEKKFGCTGCGMCCRFVGNALKGIDKASEPYKTELKLFPYNAREDGSCEKLVNNKCSVYEDRPLICRIDDLFDKYKDTHFKDETRKMRHLTESIACNRMQKFYGIPVSFRVDENQYRN